MIFRAAAIKLLPLLVGATFANNAQKLQHAQHADASSSSSSLRGNNMNGHRSPPHHRQLAFDNPGDMHCIPHESNDGTVVCSFRTFNSIETGPTQDTYNPSTHLACMTDPSKGYQYCVNAGVSFQPDPAGGNPPPGAVWPPTDPEPEPQPEPQPEPEPEPQPEPQSEPEPEPEPEPEVIGDPINDPEFTVLNAPVNYYGWCPLESPPDGGDCVTAVPNGETEKTCNYGLMACTCTLQNGFAIAPLGWMCRYVGVGGGEAVPVVAVPPPPQAGSSLPNNPPPINTVAPPPPAPVATTPPRVDTVGITVAAVQGCPQGNPDGQSCEWSHWGETSTPQRCPYEDTTFNSGWITCDCTKETSTYVCRGLNPTVSFNAAF